MNQEHKSKSVVHIDDDEDVRDVVRFALEESGYQVHTFKDAPLALSYLMNLPAEKGPGIILVDYVMPQMNGVSFIEQLKRDESSHLAHLPVALCSAKGEDEVPETLPEGTLLLQKPMELEELLDLVHRHCR